MKQNDRNGDDRLRQLYAAYGADPGRWPQNERWRHRDMPPPELVAEERDARMIEDEIRGQPSDPRESPDVDGKPGARRIPVTRACVGVRRG